MIRHDTIFTNVALTADNEPWWEGREQGAPAIDWQGRPYDPSERPGRASEFALHGRGASRTRATRQLADDPRGVPISALVFGGRRRELAPLVYEARNWQHGVLVGASVASETTAAATGEVGVVRRDSDGDEAVLRLQLRRLLGALAARWARACKRRRASSTSTGSARTPRASSCGRASARTCACCTGCSIAAPDASSAQDTRHRLPAAAGRTSTRPGLEHRSGSAGRTARRVPAPALRSEIERHPRIPAGASARARRAELYAELDESSGAWQTTTASRPLAARLRRSGLPRRRIAASAATRCRARLPEADHALALELHAVAPDERFLAVRSSARTCRWCSGPSA